MDALDRARAFFSKDAFATDIMGISIDSVEEGHAVCSMTIEPHHLNAGGSMMGGAMFTLADFAFAVAANLDKPTTVTLTSQIAFLSPPRGKRLTATAERVREGHTTCYYQVRLEDDTGHVVAMVGISGFTKHT